MTCAERHILVYKEVSTMKNEAFAPTPELLAKMDAWWRAANYLSACQLFFQLLRPAAEAAVDLLDLSHAAVIPFCPAIFRPGGAVPGDALPGVSA